MRYRTVVLSGYTWVARVPRFIVTASRAGTMYWDVGEEGNRATCGTAPFCRALYGGGAGVWGPVTECGGGRDVLEFLRYALPRNKLSVTSAARLKYIPYAAENLGSTPDMEDSLAVLLETATLSLLASRELSEGGL